VFGRPAQAREPKDQAGNVYITTPAPVFDGNDNVTTVTAANGAVTTAVYDDADQLTSITVPKHAGTDPDRTTGYTCDKVGNVRTVTAPKGTLTAADPTDFVTRYGYDELDAVLLNRFVTRDSCDGALSDLGLAADPSTGTPSPSGNPISRIELDGHCWGPQWICDVAGGIVDVVTASVTGLWLISTVTEHVNYRHACSSGFSGVSRLDKELLPARSRATSMRYCAVAR
jgi:YD repeat-containing protein